MSGKDFIAMAEAIRQNVNDAATRKAIAVALLPPLRASNSNFNVERFVAAAIGG